MNFDATPIELNVAHLRNSSGVLFVRNDTPLVRWSTTATDDAAIELADYLTDRSDLLLEPPEGT